MITSNSLNELLAELYDTQSKSRRVVDRAGMNAKHIEFKDNAIDNWHNILVEARNRRKVEAIVEFVCIDYEERAYELRAALQAMTTQSASRMEALIIEPKPTKYVSAPQHSKQSQTMSPTQPRESTSSSQSLVQPQPRKFVEPSLEFLRIGRDKHWDREEATKDFLLMITQEKTGDEKKDQQRILVLQGREAGLDSLVDRFQEMCQKVTIKRPILYARINLGPLYSDYYSLALDIVARLSRFANQKTLSDQEKILGEAYEYVAQVQYKTGYEAPSPVQFAKTLTEKYLAKIASDCTVILLLQGFDMLRDSSTREWLMKTWLTGHAWYLEGMVVLLTGEEGLDDLKGQQFISHHDLPPLNKETLKEWATQSQDYGFNWFTDEEAKIAHEICNGNPEKFRKLLDYTTRLLRIGAAEPGIVE